VRITVLDGHALNPGDNPWDELARLAAFECHARTAPAEVVARAQAADIVLTNKTPITAAAIAALPELKFIGVLATGYDIVDVQAARARGIPVSNVPVYGTDAVAEYVVALMLNHFRQPQLHSELVKQGEWRRAGDWSFWRTPLAEVAGRTLGIVGFGRIGRRLGELAAAFRMKVLVNDVFHGNPPAYDFEWREVPALFAEADVISLHCNLTPENTGMVNRQLLSRMKRGAYLINTSRGPLVDEADLAAALHEGRIGGAALDVVAIEPIADDAPILRAPNVTITPHIAWAALEARRRLTRVMAENVAAFLASRPIDVVN
jgi:glycerate dehydrogenase